MATQLDFSTPHLLRDEAEYKTAIAEVYELMTREPAEETSAFERLEFLQVLVERYEDEHFPMDLPSPRALVQFVLEQRGMSHGDLADLMGGKARVSEFFNGKRGLSLGQIRRLHEELGIPTDALIATGNLV